MIPAAQLLTGPTTFSHYKPEELSFSAQSLLSSSFVFLHVDRNLTTEKEQRMAQPAPRSPSLHTDDHSELWFSMPSSARRHQDQAQDQSAYQATSRRHIASRSASPTRLPRIPLISTNQGINKPLPPSPDSEKKKRPTVSLRNLIRRHPSGEQDSTHLQPEPYHHQRSTSADGKLSPEPYHYNNHQLSRSMPSSPLEYTQPSSLTRAHSTGAVPADMTQYQAYSPPRDYRYASRGSYEPQGPITYTRSFPETASSTASPRGSISSRPRPHSSWMSPTEPFSDPSEAHLFAAATCGLPDGFDPLSPTEVPRLQGSLFARGRQTDRIPFPIRVTPASQPSSRPPQPYEYIPRQAGEPMVSSSALPRRDSYEPTTQRVSNMAAINMELERLGLTDEEHPDDELPNYAQSQAEMNAKKRVEAAARARELEARWNSSRGRRAR